MTYDPRFGPDAQTPEQRALVLKRLLASLPRLESNATTYAHQLYDRYVAGELTWTEVREALDKTTGLTQL
ncbi:hypothetical protein LJY25_09200 [Hymenobacter sp. BT175]|uniref:hypothetical protein n=1 Tax=Hymenobacter translucens TaxID=2886507 RepID=UPI001D0F1DC7|nr:hypothetical protein [Hymenobacter translucens]MCC2546618.1 hypothetical protein [Hymenobacter translucens]